MKSFSTPSIFGAILLSGVVGYLVLNPKGKPTSGEVTQTVVVATKDLAHKSLLSAPNVKLIEMPSKDVPEGAATRLEQLTGKVHVGGTLRKGSFVFFEDAVEPSGISHISLPPGFKVIAIKLTREDSVGPFGQVAFAGEKVDVYLEPDVDRSADESANQKAKPELIVKDVFVFNVNGSTRGRMHPAAHHDNDEDFENGITIGLILKENIAEKVVDAKTRGKITIVSSELQNVSPEERRRLANERQASSNRVEKKDNGRMSW